MSACRARIKTAPNQVVEHLPGPNRITLTRRDWAVDQSTEQWLPIVGYEGLYEVSDLGRVRNVEYIDARGSVRRERMKRLAIDTSGHLQATLTKDGKKRRALVHRLVLEAFVGPCPDGMEGCHSPDPNPANNSLDNLRWDTHSENMRDTVRHGTNSRAALTECHRGHALVEPNLTYRHRAYRKRGCWACDRERTEAKRDNREFDTARADQWFAKRVSGWKPAPMKDRSHCPRGHSLTGENLRKAQFEKRGQRSCRSCSIEMSAAKRAGRPFDRARADRKYAELTR